MNEFTIRDLENLSGIKAHTLRIWEQRYSLFKPRRTSTNIRTYSSEDLRMLLNVALLNKAGFRISQIVRMQKEELYEKVLSLTGFEAYQEKLLNDMVLCMVELDAAGFEEKIEQFIRVKGFDQAIKRLVFSFLERIGLLWMTSHINVAQEHLVTQAIRQKLIAAIDKTPASKEKPLQVLMFMPEGEMHELGMLYVHYLLRAAGVNVLYLGSNLPVHDLAYAVKTAHPQKIYTHITCLPGKSDLPEFLKAFQEVLPGKELYLSGAMNGFPPQKLPPNILFKRSVNEVIDSLSFV